MTAIENFSGASITNYIQGIETYGENGFANIWLITQVPFFQKKMSHLPHNRNIKTGFTQINIAELSSKETL